MAFLTTSSSCGWGGVGAVWFWLTLWQLQVHRFNAVERAENDMTFINASMCFINRRYNKYTNSKFWCSLCVLCLLVCQVSVTVDDSGLYCCICPFYNYTKIYIILSLMSIKAFEMILTSIQLTSHLFTPLTSFFFWGGGGGEGGCLLICVKSYHGNIFIPEV